SADAPRPYKYYWMTGDFSIEKSDDLNLDQVALDAGYISIVPTTFDLTAHNAMDYCKGLESK
ncbi:MAG: 5'/3'-nucleotidase SurE, partial [Paludibacteraceae bacterium]|nr:5'/3'-nucleotidase SurE [Paludibacteraceae bacterium]